MSKPEIVLSGEAFRGVVRLARMGKSVLRQGGFEGLGPVLAGELLAGAQWLVAMKSAGMGKVEGPELRWRTDWCNGPKVAERS